MPLTWLIFCSNTNIGRFRNKKQHCNFTQTHFITINVSIYYVMFGSQWKAKDNIARALFMLGRCMFLLRVRAIKHDICSLPLAPNAQSANLTLIFNPLTWKRTNARRAWAYSTSNKQIQFVFAYTEWYSIDECPVFVVSHSNPHLCSWLPHSPSNQMASL